MIKNLHHLFLRFADGEAADGIAVKTDCLEAFERFVAQMLEHAALDDTEQRIRILQTIEFVTGASSPAERKTHGVRSFFFSGRTAVDFVRCALVKNHSDIGVQHLLNFHRNFRRQEETFAVDRRSKTHAFFGNLAQLA